jgi:4-hydroxy-tetrahydrodipicolinate synthase
MRTFSGVWIPLVTPFFEGGLDLQSYDRLVEHYIREGAAGLFPLGTTGESPVLDAAEASALIEHTLAIAAGRIPVFVGVAGNATAKVVHDLKWLENHAVGGIVSVCPYYNRPSQDGLFEHFNRVAEATDRPILIYNIPYRTGVNLANDTVLRLAERHRHIVGVKDSSGSLTQSIDLLRRRPSGFAVLTGEDVFFYTMLAHGADGGILAAAHLATREFIAVFEAMRANDHHHARLLWSRLEPLVALLFQEANPMPVKYCLWRQGLLRSPECRLPLTHVSATLASTLDGLLDGLAMLPQRWEASGRQHRQ